MRVVCWLSVLVGHVLGLLVVWRYREADNGDVARIFSTPKMDPIACSSGSNASCTSDTGTATKIVFPGRRQGSMFANPFVKDNRVLVVG